ncbi:Hypothetical predicted protein [Cloeon dipterum]|uniref:Uncharacterized protein n=1 Tax=Cloeon dipterum TaxID=197152 RepID=A0A8S1C733_9INSE|nr:Hypothetical predicted protein [Cloeon dipterum]
MSAATCHCRAKSPDVARAIHKLRVPRRTLGSKLIDRTMKTSHVTTTVLRGLHSPFTLTPPAPKRGAMPLFD